MNDVFIIKKYIDGYSIRKIAEEFNLNRRYISKLLKKNNIKIRNNKENSRKYFVDENFFEIIDSEEKAYWLGFIYADGFIESKRKNASQKFGITISSIDEEHLIKLNKTLNSTYEITKIKGSGFNEKGEFSRLLITSQKMVDDLKLKGVVENKSKILSYPDFLNKNLQKHFIRGYLDGDGSIYYCSQAKNFEISFTGTESILLGINNFFNRKNKISKNKNKDIYSLHYGGKNNVFNILDILYKDAGIFLDRKHALYLKSIENMSKDRV